MGEISFATFRGSLLFDLVPGAGEGPRVQVATSRVRVGDVKSASPGKHNWGETGGPEGRVRIAGGERSLRAPGYYRIRSEPWKGEG
jgi:hypothetical protein